MSYGLTERQETLLKEIFSNYLSKGRVLVYGSRAKGNYTERSDVDLVIQGCPLDRNLIADIQDAVLESDFPYLTDIQFYEEIQNPALLDHVNRVGQLLLEKK